MQRLSRVGGRADSRLPSVVVTAGSQHTVAAINVVSLATLLFVSEVRSELEQICHDAQPIWHCPQHHVSCFEHLRNAKLAPGSIKCLHTSTRLSPLSHTCHLHVSPLSHTRVTCTSTTTGWSVCNGTFNTGSIYIGHVQWRMIELQLWRTRNNIWIQKASAWQDLYGDNNPHSSEDLLAVQRSSEPISWCWQ